MDELINKNNKANKAVREHLKSLNILYDQIKNKIIKDVLDKIYKEKDWTSLKILDVGIGGGFWIDFFLKKGADVTGVDTDNLFIEGDRKRYPKAKFILSDATSIKINEKFNLIFAKDVIEHIENDEKFLANMSSHLNNDGLMLINTQNSWSLNYLIQGSYRRFLKGDKNWCGWATDHKRFYNVKSLKKKLEAAGFKGIKWFGNYYFPYRIIAERIGVESLSKVFCLPELIGLYDKFPFNITGWSIGVIAKKISNR